MINFIKKKRTIKRFIIIIILCLCIDVLSLMVVFVNRGYISKKAGFVNVLDYKVVNYDKESEKVSLLLNTDYSDGFCYSIIDDAIVDGKFEDGNCSIELPVSSKEIIFKDKEDNDLNTFDLGGIIYQSNLKDRYYLPLEASLDLQNSISVLGDGEITYEVDNDVVSLENNVMISKNNGSFTLKIKYNDEILKEISVYATDGIVKRPETFDYKKSYLACEAYDDDKAKLMDEILEYKINEAGYGTRAGVVEAARFLTLDFPYRLTYFYENGRVSNTSAHHADGEGRYYHKGLFLSKDKYDDLEYTVSGPAMWGCKLTNWEPDPPKYIRGNKMPNGLDCSGFVSWVLLNGGFDVGDVGAGESSNPNQLTDKGDYTRLTKDLIDSGKIKTGDLFNFSGHIAILAGQNENNYYIAETLPYLNGVVLKEYSKKTVMKTFTHVVLMEDTYVEDGNLTDMWY